MQKNTENIFGEYIEVVHGMQIYDRLRIEICLDLQTKGNLSILSALRWIKEKRYCVRSILMFVQK